MKRSVYSLVLIDDVVEEIDRLAYAMNTSRSNLINQILAEKVSFITPEKRIDDIFSSIQELMVNDCFQVQQRQSNVMMSIKSPIRYKYRPTVKYNVELYRNPQNSVGNLKVSFRTQSQQLIVDVTNFFELWSKIEEKYLKDIFKEGVSFKIEEGRYTRTFMLNSNADNTKTANAISTYIKLLDMSLKLYFAYLDNTQIAFEEIDKSYYKYLQAQPLII